MDYVLTFTDAPEPRDKDAAGAALYEHNSRATGIADRRPLAVVVSDTATSRVLGGIWGRTELGVLFLDMFFIPECLRGRGLGGRLLLRAEDEARHCGCGRAVVETSSFQAPHFYENHGYLHVRKGRVRIARACPYLPAKKPFADGRGARCRISARAEEHGNFRLLAIPRREPTGTRTRPSDDQQTR
jgi:GNAT superfamily N-acetyltransferase